MKWEYLVTKYVGGPNHEGQVLDNLGAEGWELVAVVYLPQVSVIDSKGIGGCIKHYWKRPKL